MSKTYRRVNIKLDEDVYLELIKRYGIRGLSKGINELLKHIMFKTQDVVNVKTQNVIDVKTEKHIDVKTQKHEWEYEPATQKQIEYLKDLIKKVAKVLNKTEDEIIREYDVDFENMTKKDANELIDFFKQMIKDEGEKISQNLGK